MGALKNGVKTRVALSAALFALILVIGNPAFGQTGTDGSFIGTITDSSGGSIPGAEVSVKQLNTGLTKTATSDAAGNFVVAALPIGPYSVAVRATGFKRWEVERIELVVGDRNRISPVLSVGEVTETISVQAESEVLQTEKSSLDTVVQMQQIRELPLATRNPLSLVSLVPGMRTDSTQDGGERSTFVQGQGLRNNKTSFQLDGLNANAPMDEGGTGIPNVDTIAEFNVQTLNFNAESGRTPTQVLVVTKSGTNQLHGAVWEFLQNDIFNARNTFAVNKNRVRRNQFGAAIGGPILKNRTFFFGSYEGTVVRNARVYNSLAVTPAMKNGDFSALSTPIIDPTTKVQFPGNRIPADRITAASRYFLPLILEANSADGFYRNNASAKNDTHEGTIRVDHNITGSQRIYGRYVTVRQPKDELGYTPDPRIVGFSEVQQHNVGLNYSWTLSPRTLLTASAGTLRTDSSYGNPSLGRQNDVELAGIQGIPTAGREAWIGPPNLNFGSGYTGVSFPGGWGVPGALYGNNYNAKASLSHIWSAHTFSTGFEYGDWRTYGAHGSAASRGQFDFNNLYTGNGFADYLLGLPSATSRNDPLTTFGNERAPYVAGYVQDVWRVKENLTLELGLRYERWLAHRNYQYIASLWEPGLNKMVLATDSNGQPNLNAFPVTPYLVAAMQGLFVTAPEAGIPNGLYEANGNWAPRLGIVYRPFKSRDFVLRGGYGTYYNTYTGNRGGSMVNAPHWSAESLAFSLSSPQRWETAWPADPQSFSAFAVYAPRYNIRPARTHEWNVTVQTALPFRTALTVSYVGTRLNNEIGAKLYNEATIGLHTNLQADRPFPRFSTIQLYENLGRNWYHALQAKAERRFASGLSFIVSYSFSRSMAENLPNCETCALIPFSPDWYNRGRTSFDRRHVEYAAVVWELPYGRGKHFGSSINRWADLAVGGWQLAFTQQGISGAPIDITAGTPNLGNNFGTRADIVGNPAVDNQGPGQWINRAAFATPAQYTFGSSSMGIVEGPGFFSLNTNLAKNFRLTESKYFQFRWEMFNATNRANYNNPSGQTWALTSGTFGRLTSAGDARYMQFGLKFLF